MSTFHLSCVSHAHLKLDYYTSLQPPLLLNNQGKEQKEHSTAPLKIESPSHKAFLSNTLH